MNGEILQIMASAEAAEKTGLFGSLGIDWTMLVIQTVAFLVLLAVLRKWVYPPLVAMLDKRDANLKAGAKAADEAKAAADRAETEVAALLEDARREAAGIVATAKTEASAMVEAAEQKSKKKADALIAAAKSDIEGEVQSARKQLRNELVSLVASATEKVTSKAMTDSLDKNLIKASIEEAQ